MGYIRKKNKKNLQYYGKKKRDLETRVVAPRMYVCIQWIPSQKGLICNKVADRLTKTGTFVPEKSLKQDVHGIDKQDEGKLKRETLHIPKLCKEIKIFRKKTTKNISFNLPYFKWT